MKRFTKKTKAVENATLAPWIPSIRNWIWTIMKENDGCGALIVEHWRSMLYHIIGIHEWPDDASFELVHTCSHADLSSANIAYLSASSPAYAAFAQIVEDRQLHNRLQRCTLFLQTSLSESFHSLLCKYLPKRIKFTGRTFESRTKLAIMDWNENINRPVATNEEGGEVLRFTHPAAAGAWRAKRVRVDRSKIFSRDLMENLADAAAERWKSGVRVSTTTSLITHLPLVTAYEPLDHAKVAANLIRD
jgi:hypothetical protein